MKSRNNPVMGETVTLMGTTTTDRVIVVMTMTSGDQYTVIDNDYPFPKYTLYILLPFSAIFTIPASPILRYDGCIVFPEGISQDYSYRVFSWKGHTRGLRPPLLIG